MRIRGPCRCDGTANVREAVARLVLHGRQRPPAAQLTVESAALHDRETRLTVNAVEYGARVMRSVDVGEEVLHVLRRLRIGELDDDASLVRAHGHVRGESGCRGSER